MAHLVALKNLCRVCGRSVVTKLVKVKYQCSEYREKLQTAFGIDTCLDSSDVHSQHFCHACKNVLYRASKVGYQHRTDVFLAWDEHIEGNCSVCVCIVTQLGKEDGQRRSVAHPRMSV